MQDSRWEKDSCKICIRQSKQGRDWERRENERWYLPQSSIGRQQLTAPRCRHRRTQIMMKTAWLQVLQQQPPPQQQLLSGPAMAHGSPEPSPTDWCCWETWRHYFRKTTQTSMLCTVSDDSCHIKSPRSADGKPPIRNKCSTDLGVTSLLKFFSVRSAQAAKIRLKLQPVYQWRIYRCTIKSDAQQRSISISIISRNFEAKLQQQQLCQHRHTH